LPQTSFGLDCRKSNSTGQKDIIKLLIVRLTELDGKPITEDELEELPPFLMSWLLCENLECSIPLSQRRSHLSHDQTRLFFYRLRANMLYTELKYLIKKLS
jgi:hypothetical protein